DENGRRLDMNETPPPCQKCGAERRYVYKGYFRSGTPKRAARCPDCTRKAQRKRFEKEENRRRNNDTVKRSHERYPERYRARHLAYRARRSGKLVPEPCEVCGRTDVHAHHTDYSKPLDVVWLCPVHHGEAHRSSL